MSEFDTHGGYFAPQGYMRVNAGGSHEENPNGGVQVGVDPSGAPNLLEEGEPVYNDYVYSDNITADAAILEAHNLPKKYGGKLYSEIADAYVDEVADMPLDPIANRGLNEMLVRLAEAQEEQKAEQQRKELEEEIANLSPEELDQLMAMLEEDQQPQPQEMMPSTEMPMAPEQQPMVPGMPVEQPPMMADGGRLNLFADGNPLQRRTHYRSLQWPYTNAYNQFDAPIYDGTDEPITPLRDGAGGAYQYLPLFTGLNVPLSIPSLRSTLPTPIPRNSSRVVTSASTVIPEEEQIAAALATAAPTDKPASTSPAAPTASGAPRRRTATAAPRVVPATLPKDYKVPDNFIKILDSDEPGFGVNPLATDIISRAMAREQQEALPRPTAPTIDKMDALRTIASSQTPVTPAETGSGLLPVWPRYAGAVTSGLLGLYNAFQKPDEYHTPAYNPVLPQGRMHFIDPIYNPLDQNQAVNDVLAANAGTARAIGNSGLGAATQATLLANDYNAGRNLGAARAQIWDANNQRLNDVIARRNQNAGMLAQFDYGQSRDRAYIKNDAAWRNLQNAMRDQQLNYAAEGQKYAAIQNQIDAVADALSKIGHENGYLNMLNGDESRLYAMNRMYDPYYKRPIYSKCGGYIKKIKK